jgi:hypothetical protein
LRIVVRDFRREKWRYSLDLQCKRATPRQWSYYTTASTSARILENRTPNLLYELIYGNSTWNERHPGQRTSFDTSRPRIGRQAIHNRLKELFLQVNKEWCIIQLSKDALCTRFKEAFFPYNNEDEKRHFAKSYT